MCAGSCLDLPGLGRFGRPFGQPITDGVRIGLCRGGVAPVATATGTVQGKTPSEAAEDSGSNEDMASVASAADF